MAKDEREDDEPGDRTTVDPDAIRLVREELAKEEPDTLLGEGPYTFGGKTSPDALEKTTVGEVPIAIPPDNTDVTSAPDPEERTLPGPSTDKDQKPLDAAPNPPRRVVKEIDSRHKHRSVSGLRPTSDLPSASETPAAANPNPLDSAAALPEESDASEDAVNDEEHAGPDQKRRRFRRGETLLEHLPSWLAFTSLGAKVIPLLIAAFILFSILLVVASMMHAQVGTGTTEHVTLRFTSTNDPSAEDQGGYQPLPTITLETDPTGILVVIDRRILGPTPLSFESPVRADRIGIELSSPYYETWVGEAEKTPDNEVRYTAKLSKKKR